MPIYLGAPNALDDLLPAGSVLDYSRYGSVEELLREVARWVSGQGVWAGWLGRVAGRMAMCGVGQECGVVKQVQCSLLCRTSLMHTVRY